MFPPSLAIGLTLLSAASLATDAQTGAATSVPPAPPAAVSSLPGNDLAWVPPLAPPRVVREFAPPSQRWLAGHRGVDLSTQVGAPVASPVVGVVIFAGTLAGRGVVSIEARSSSGALYRSSVEPVRALVHKGQRVQPGERIGVTDASAHCPAACLHWGVRRDGEYVDPLALLRGPRRVRLLPVSAPISLR